MVKTVWPFFLLLATANCASESVCTKGSEFEPPLCPSQYTKIAAIKINKNAVSRTGGKSSEIECKAFILNNETVERYFQLAKVTNENDAHHTLDWSPCFASGVIEFKDGKKASWQIDQFRVGHLFFNQGKDEILYCPSCKFPPFL